MERTEGYYWVMSNDEWRVAQWEWGFWTLTGANECIYYDKDFDLIGEKILPPNN
jgi:hypothetical protein